MSWACPLLASGPVECRSRGSLDFVQRMRNTEANFFVASSVAAVVGEAYIVGGPSKCQHRFRSFLNFLRRFVEPPPYRPFAPPGARDTRHLAVSFSRFPHPRRPGWPPRSAASAPFEGPSGDAFAVLEHAIGVAAPSFRAPELRQASSRNAPRAPGRMPSACLSLRPCLHEPRPPHPAHPVPRSPIAIPYKESRARARGHSATRRGRARLRPWRPAICGPASLARDTICERPRHIQAEFPPYLPDRRYVRRWGTPSPFVDLPRHDRQMSWRIIISPLHGKNRRRGCRTTPES